MMHLSQSLQPRRWHTDAVDIVATVVGAVLCAAWIRGRATPLHLPAFWVLLPLLIPRASRVPRIGRVLAIAVMSFVIGAMVSLRWMR